MPDSAAQFTDFNALAEFGANVIGRHLETLK